MPLKHCNPKFEMPPMALEKNSGKSQIGMLRAAQGCLFEQILLCNEQVKIWLDPKIS